MKRKHMIAILSLALVAVLAVVMVNRESEELIDEEVAFSMFSLNAESRQIVDDIKAIEALVADSFDLEDREAINQATLAFLRKDRYGYNTSGLSSFVWATYAGGFENELDIDIRSYSEEVAEIEAYVENLGNFSEPMSGIAIDFVHLVVVTDLETTELALDADKDVYTDILFSWGGDMETFMVDVAKKSTSNDPESLYALADQLLGADGTHFSTDDLYADLDGVNIATLMDTEELLFSEAVEKYYESGLFNERKTLFIDTFESEEDFIGKVNFLATDSFEEKHSEDAEMMEYLESFLSLKSLMNRFVYNSDEAVTLEVREAVANAFIDRILN